jgi:CDGSH-type Zn-finger protein
LIGQTLSHFKILAKLGEGGMGEVYRAADTKLGREVAIKILPEAVAGDSERLARFRREAKILASLNHPHIAAIYGLEESEARRFLVLELVDGPSLADRLAAGPLSLTESLRVAVQICKALAAAHEEGIVHRDLKPANVRLTRDGRVKILDFGLARVIGSSSELSLIDSAQGSMEGLTLPGTLLGTVAYMSPEQIRGRQVDHRSDLFSFGVLLYKMVTGALPFEGRTPMEILGGILADRPIPAQDRRSDLPPGLFEVLARLLAHQPSERHQSFDSVLAELDELTDSAMRTRLRRGRVGLRRSARARRKLCVCGRSGALPLCDGSHMNADWSCAVQIERSRLGFLAGRRYQNLALKLASHYEGVLFPTEEGSESVELLVILVDGTDLDEVVETVPSIEADERCVISFAVGAELLGEPLAGSQLVTLDDVDALQAFKKVVEVLEDGPPSSTTSRRRPSLKSAFISHSVADEGEIMPVMDYLQHYFRSDLFTCADSIEPGAAWREKIDLAVRSKDCFVYLISKKSSGSIFCAFEVGVAHALSKPIYVISLDGTLPPVFLQHVQTVDLTRIQRRKPWLDRQDLLLEELIRVLR